MTHSGGKAEKLSAFSGVLSQGNSTFRLFATAFHVPFGILRLSAPTAIRKHARLNMSNVKFILFNNIDNILYNIEYTIYSI